MAVLTMLGLTACGEAPADRAGITEHWPAMAAPQTAKPKAGDCVRDFNVDGVTFESAGYKTIRCDLAHWYEIVMVGQHTGAGAEAGQPPHVKSEEYSQKWRECDKETDAYLGGPWRDRNLEIWVRYPSNKEWDVGARWYVCAASLADGILFNEPVKDGYRTSTKLQFGCYEASSSGQNSSIDCQILHNAEYVGVFESDSRNDGLGNHERCAEMVADFVGSTQEYGTWIWTPSEAEWRAGDRTSRCFVWLNQQRISHSLRG